MKLQFQQLSPTHHWLGWQGTAYFTKKLEVAPAVVDVKNVTRCGISETLVGTCTEKATSPLEVYIPAKGRHHQFKTQPFFNSTQADTSNSMMRDYLTFDENSLASLKTSSALKLSIALFRTFTVAHERQLHLRVVWSTTQIFFIEIVSNFCKRSLSLNLKHKPG